MPNRTCRVCGRELRANNKTGVCSSRNPACLSERHRAWRAGMPLEWYELRKAAQREAFARLSAERRAQRNASERASYARNPAARMLTAARRQRKRGVLVTVTVADILVPVACPVCGVVMTSGQARSSDRSPSLDRYEPALGYVPGNIMVICRGCNRRKQNHTGEQMVELGRAIIAAKAAYDRMVAGSGHLT